MVQKTVDLQHVSILDNTVLTDSIFQKLHGMSDLFSSLSLFQTVKNDQFEFTINLSILQYRILAESWRLLSKYFLFFDQNYIRNVIHRTFILPPFHNYRRFHFHLGSDRIMEIEFCNENIAPKHSPKSYLPLFIIIILVYGSCERLNFLAFWQDR